MSLTLTQKLAVEVVLIIAVVVGLGFAGRYAINQYNAPSLSPEVMEVTSRSSLKNMRSGIIIYYANKAVQTGIAAWPELDSLATPGVVMEHKIPKNPYQDNAPNSIVTGVTKGVIVGTRGGWAYKASTGEIWLNTNSVGENKW